MSIMLFIFYACEMKLHSGRKQIQTPPREATYVNEGKLGNESERSNTDYINDEGWSTKSSPLASVDDALSTSSSK